MGFRPGKDSDFVVDPISSARSTRVSTWEQGRKCQRPTWPFRNRPATRNRAHRQRFQHPGRHRQRIGQPDREPGPAAVDLPDGRPGLGQEHVPVEHRRAAHLVHDPRQQARLHRAQEGSRLPRRDEPGDGEGRRADARARRRGRLRRAAQAQRAAQRPHRSIPVPFDKLVAAGHAPTPSCAASCAT